MFSRAATAALAIVLCSSMDALAARHFTDIGGREVTIARGPSRVIAASRLAPRPHATVTINAGADVDAANNDFRRIQNAINAAAATDTIILNGTFDFTQPFAAAAWALGNDNTASTADDYSVYVPANLNTITLTATSLGTATIQGPGDLAAVNLEGFLVFDGGDNSGWTISNLRILDFDLAIGMFNGAGGSDAFNATIIQNNFIRIPTDLNATVAPTDVNQNIGIHYSFGLSQSISNNTLEIPGNGVSASPNFSSTVGMQSNTSGGNVYNGLSITNNVIHVVNAQSANPENILGIWENAHAHTSTILIQGNQFINDAPGNDSALNLQRAFRVTSHSSAATNVTYSGNSVGGANIGFQWLAGSNFGGNQAVRLVTNSITACATGVLVQSQGAANIDRNVITGSGLGGGIHVINGSLAPGAIPDAVYQSNVSGGSGDGIWIESGATVNPGTTLTQNDLGGNTGFGFRNDAGPPLIADSNWWGSNLAAAVAGEASGNVDLDPWLASGTDVSGAFGFQPFMYATTSGTITTFAGTAGADTGSLLAGDPVTMTMNGETAFTALAQLLTFNIQLGAQDDVFTLGLTGVPTTLNGDTGNDTLVATNFATSWNITGANSGTIASTPFTNVESLRGGTAADSFIFGAAGSIGQSINGSTGTDTLDNSAIPASTIAIAGPGTLDGFMGTATGIGVGYDNINVLIATPIDLAVTKSGPATVTAGATITYTITITNGGPGNALNATLADTLPAGTTFVSLTSPGGWSCTTPAVGAAGSISCSRATTPAGPNVFTLVVNSPPNTPGNVTNTANIGATNDSTPGNNSASAVTNVQTFADLGVTKTGTATVTLNAPITYTITLTNGGPNDATTATLSDPLPAGSTFVSLTSPAGWSCTTPAVGAGGTVSCNRASMPSGNNVFTLVVNAPGTPGIITNTATISATNDTTAGNNSASAVTDVQSLADLGVTKSGPASVAPSAPISYTITLTNGGPNPATTATLSDPLPAGTTFVSLTSPGGWTCTTPAVGAAGTVSCNNASMPVGNNVFTLVVNAPGISTSVTNTATISAANDTTPGNNSAGATTAVVASADLGITKAGPGAVAPGGNVDFTITVANLGPNGATNVVVSDTIPANTTFVSATPSQGSCSGAAVVTCNLGTLANSASATIQLVLTPTITNGTVVNTATVTAADPDPAPANNTSTSTVIVSSNIPTLDWRTLMALVVMLAMIAMWRMR